MVEVQTRILSSQSVAEFENAVETAAGLLSRGEVVALPTETVYGLAANALNSDAVKRVFEIKGRPAFNPVIVHVNGLDMAMKCAAAWPREAGILAGRFWPGALTMVLPRASRIPDVVTAGGDTVALRWPSHPFMQAVIHRCGFPLAAPSANRSGALSPTSPEHVMQTLGGRIPLIVDGGHCSVGIESTVIDLSRPPWRVLRPGMIGAREVEALLGSAVAGGTGEGAGDAGPIRSPGMLEKHYAPRARLRVISWENDLDLARRIGALAGSPARVCVVAHRRIPSAIAAAQVSVIPDDPEAYARAIYAELHRCDQTGAEWILVEEVPNEPGWEGVRDRLLRASRD